MRRLAAMLEAQGWSVFWDRKVRAGLRWEDVISEALGEARCVLTAWSDSAVRSHWVKDEAAEGRERDILVPVLLDGANPPMGFRQIQAVDLSDWTGSADHPGLRDLIAAISDILGEYVPTKVPPNKNGTPKRTLLITGGIAVVATAIVIGIAIQSQERSAEIPPARTEPPLVTKGKPHFERGEIPKFFLGIWRGEVQGPLLKQQLTLTVDTKKSFETISTDTGHCSVELKLTDKNEDKTSITFEGKVMKGNCVAGSVVLTKLDESSISYDGKVLGAFSIRGNLNKSGRPP